MKIGTCTSKPGQIAWGELTLAKFEGQHVRVPVAIAQGLKPGKTAFISGGIHGDEANGMWLVHKFLEELDPKRIEGTIVILPVINTLGFKQKTRRVPYDNKDLNRSFLHVRTKTLANVIAENFLEKVVRQCDFGLDFHDSGYHQVNLLHVRIDQRRQIQEIRNLAVLFGTQVVLERDGEVGMLAVQAYKRYKVPVLTVEIGGGELALNYYTKSAMQGIKNVLVFNGMLSGRIRLPKVQFFSFVKEEYFSGLDGIIKTHVRLGELVRKGTLLAEIFSPITKERQLVRATANEVIVNIKSRSLISKGDIMFMALKLNDSELHIRQGSKTAIYRKASEIYRLYKRRVGRKRADLIV